jgi:hypothetical protein
LRGPDVAGGPGHRGLRAQLSATVAGAAGPYGYTISLGGSISLTVHHLGSPGYGEVMLMMLGAVIGFVTLEFIAQGSFHPIVPAPDIAPTMWGNAHVPSAGGAITAVWGLVHVFGEPFAWAVTGFTATSVYFTVSAAQRVTIARVRARRGQAADSSASSTR